jgi:hypothetical protein
VEKHGILRYVVRSEVGTSLLELIVASAAGLIILAATIQSLSFFKRQFVNQQSALAQQQDVRLSLELLEQEIHLTESDALSVMKQDEIQFAANINGLSTTVMLPVGLGQTTVPVEDGRGWPKGKTVVICWSDRCDARILARDGQRAALTVSQPISTIIPVGASVTVRNTVRYYSNQDENGAVRFLRQVDGGASVLVGDIRAVRFSYWTEQGRPATRPGLIRLITVEIGLPGRSSPAVRDISLRV